MFYKDYIGITFLILYDNTNRYPTILKYSPFSLLLPLYEPNIFPTSANKFRFKWYLESPDTHRNGLL